MRLSAPVFGTVAEMVGQYGQCELLRIEPAHVMTLSIIGHDDQLYVRIAPVDPFHLARHEPVGDVIDACPAVLLR